MTTEHAGDAEFTQLVTNHVFSAEHFDEASAVVDLEGVPDEFGNDGAGSSPRLDGTTPTRLVHLLNLSVELLVNEWAFFSDLDIPCFRVIESFRDQKWRIVYQIFNCP